MSENSRLLDEGATELEALLLRAGRDDAPLDPSARARTIENIKIASHAALLVSSGVLGARWLARGWSILAKPLVAGVGVAATAGVAYVAWREPPATTVGFVSLADPVGAPPTSVASARRQDVTPDGPVALRVTPEATRALAQSPIPVPSNRTTTVVRSKVASAASSAAATVAIAPTNEDAAPVGRSALHEETTQLSTSRRLLEASRAPEALAALDRYDARFAKGGVLAEEAAVLRVEALLATGDVANARKVVSDFGARYPTSSYGARIRSLIEHDE